MYKVEFIDRHKQAISDSLITENLFGSVYKERNKHMLFNFIINFQKTSNAVSKDDVFVTSSNENQ